MKSNSVCNHIWDETNRTPVVSICLIMNTTTDRIGLHSVGRNKVLLPINYHYNKICDVLALNTRQHKKFYEFSYML